MKELSAPAHPARGGTQRHRAGASGQACAYIVREVLAPVLLGVLAGWFVLGPAGIDPTNIGWNSHGDAATHYLGWWFFRNSPWHFPLGTNPDYGLEIGSSIFYSDSIPLLAFVFKPFADFLPTPFQYFGIWVLSCFILQALFAWRVLGAFPETRSWPVRVSALGLFAFSPPMLIRIGGHSALVGQWLILAGFGLYLTPRPRVRRYAWPALVLVSVLVHSYLFVMVLALWFADALRRFRERDLRALVLDAALVALAALLGLWQAGFFLVRVASQGGYGELGMNLLAPLNPDIYSYVLPPVAPPWLGFHEGYNFAGLGTLLLLPALLLALALRRSALWRGVSSHWPLALVLLALTLFAVTHHVKAGIWSATLPLPESWIAHLSTLRSSGRMFWVVHYVLLAALVLLLARGYGARVACLLLALASAAQVADTSRGWWKHLHAHLEATRSRTWPTPLKDPFWYAAGKEYRVVRRVPPGNSAPDYTAFAQFAASWHMATDAAYLARIDATSLSRASEELRRVLASGGFDPGTLYVLDASHAAQVAETLDPEVDLLARVDGYYVLAPGWGLREHSPWVTPPRIGLRDIQPGIAMAQEVFFGTEGDGTRYLAEGWSGAEAWGVWSEGPRADLSLPVDARAAEQLHLHLQVGAFVPKEVAEQTVDCAINGVPAATWRFATGDGPAWRSVSVPPSALESARNTLELAVRFDIQSPASPKSQGLSEDSRRLGLALHRLKLSLSRP